MAKARAEIEITASENKLAAGLARARARFQQFSGSIARGMGSAMSGALSGAKWLGKKTSLGDAGKHAVGELGGTMLTRGVDAIADAANGVRNFERDLVRLGIAGSLNGEQLAALRNSIRGVSAETGVASQEILAGTAAYVDLTGDIKGATAAQRAFARIAQASGATVGDVATATAALQGTMQLDAGDIEAAFSGLIVQGKAGAVSVRDFAGELATLAPQFAQFGNKKLFGIAEMGAGFQVIRQGAGSASEAATQFQALMGEIVSSNKDLAKIGIQVFEKNPKTGAKELRSFTAIMKDMAENKALNDPARLQKIFGRKESQAAVRTIRDQIDKMEELTKAGEDHGAVQRDLTSFLESDAGRIDAAFNRAKEAIATAFTPERITAFTNAIEGLVSKMGPLVDGVSAIGSAFGKLYGAGQSIRGAISGETNPWATDEDEMRQRLIDINEESDPEKKKGKSAAYIARLSNQKTFATARDSILGAEVNERSSPESIRRAVEAKFTKNDGQLGALGTQEAGALYLKNAGIDDKKAADMHGENLAKALTDMGDKIAKAIAASQPKIELDHSKIHTSASKGSTKTAGGG